MRIKTKIQVPFLPQQLTSLNGEWVVIEVYKVNTDDLLKRYFAILYSLIEQIRQNEGVTHTKESLHLYHLENIFCITPTFFKDQQGNLLAKYESKHYLDMNTKELEYLIDKVKCYWIEKGMSI